MSTAQPPKVQLETSITSQQSNLPLVDPNITTDFSLNHTMLGSSGITQPNSVLFDNTTSFSLPQNSQQIPYTSFGTDAGLYTAVTSTPSGSGGTTKHDLNSSCDSWYFFWWWWDDIIDMNYSCCNCVCYCDTTSYSYSYITDGPDRGCNADQNKQEWHKITYLFLSFLSLKVKHMIIILMFVIKKMFLRVYENLFLYNIPKQNNFLKKFSIHTIDEQCL